jgi:hypothetical protein
VTSVSDKIALAINMIMGISLTTTLHIIKQKEGGNYYSESSSSRSSE